ncbi:cell division protein ZapA [Paremcibacter congregatus]|uniref:Cell division protein ZapA n=1 Tax=Paremcibacter congregatus TaxID=2043170 RepID=A0A2G4YTR5_9PROT|nr:cell division protein ZapA [Paremcibacter congregatus]PHZ85708.1 hypothetical protein CRD36_03205 [Paremcibacter congregatus]QDE26670.1 cell division protein ZapA [Paremcibacter congregatus]|tara:strand:+ start:60 stop:386 length:327 start_codon:yes stop_codon:yes gene_type:complete
MANVTVKFNHRSYHLACSDGDGESERLIRLAKYVDDKAAMISSKMGAVSEPRLMLMTAILLADELDEARGGGALQENGAVEDATHMEQTLARTLKRIEDITRQVEAEV